MIDSVFEELLRVKTDFMYFFNDGTTESNRMFPLLYNVDKCIPVFNNEFIAIIEDNGLSLEVLEGLRDKFYKLYDLVHPFLIANSDCPMHVLLVTYLNCFSPIIIDAIDDLEHELSLYTGVYTSDDPSIKKQYLLDIGCTKIVNFYKLIPPIIKSLRKIMKDVKKKYESINFNDFTFSPRFKCLSTFREDIKDKNLKPEEIQALLRYYAVLLIKGFVYTQIEFNCTTEYLDDSYYKSFFRLTSITNQSLNLFINICFRIYLFDPIFKVLENMDEELNDFYQKHTDDPINAVLTPIVNDIIPYLNSLKTHEEAFKLIIEKSTLYESLAQGFNLCNSKIDGLLINNHQFGYKKFIYLLYFKDVPFEIENPPDESYVVLFHYCMDIVLSSMFFNMENRYEKQIYPHVYYNNPRVSEIKGNIDSLQKQKYYIIWKMVTEFHNDRIETQYYLHASTCALILSLIDWKISIDSNDARTIESWIKENLPIMCNKWHLQQGNGHGHFKYVNKWRDFIIKEVCPAKNPFSIEEIDSKMDLESYHAGCCNIS